MIQPGTHKAIIVDHGIAYSSEKNTPEVFINFTIDGQPTTADLWLTDKAIGKSVEQLRLCGYAGTDFEIPRPSAVSWIGFCAAWGAVAIIILGFISLFA